MFGSCKKGKRAENEVGKMLEGWWGKLEPGCVFKSTPMSGGWANPVARGEFGTAGDLVTTAKRFPFCVEVKRREGWSVNNVLDGKPSPVWKWWEQTKTSAKECSKSPILFFKRNREEWRVMLEPKFFTPNELKYGWWLVSSRKVVIGWWSDEFERLSPKDLADLVEGT